MNPSIMPTFMESIVIDAVLHDPEELLGRAIGSEFLEIGRLWARAFCESCS
jgi:hypothetical protein